MRLDDNRSCGHYESRRLRESNGDQRVSSPRTDLQREPSLGAGAHTFLKQLSSSARGEKAGSLVDRNARIARAKTVVIDGAVTLTGSYNSTSASLTISRTVFEGIFVGILRTFFLMHWFLMQIVRSGADEEGTHE